MKQTILLLFILASFNALAQDITHTDIAWQISREDDINTGTFDERGGTLTSYHTDSVAWRDANGARIQSLKIREVNGAWSNIQNTGTIIYEADTGGNAATITFSRDSRVLRITIAVLQPDGFPLIREFTIQNFTTL